MNKKIPKTTAPKKVKVVKKTAAPWEVSSVPTDKEKSVALMKENKALHEQISNLKREVRHLERKINLMQWNQPRKTPLEEFLHRASPSSWLPNDQARSTWGLDLPTHPAGFDRNLKVIGFWDGDKGYFYPEI